MKCNRKFSGMVFSCLLLSCQADSVCLFCKDVVEPMDCDTVTRCGSHEHCYIDEFITTTGGVRYNLGCRDIAQCTASGNVRRRRSTGTLVCSECCFGNLCNSAGCGNPGYPALTGPLCYDCPQQLYPEDCSKITICGQNEVCLLQKIINSVTHKVRYQTRCESDRLCHEEQKHQQLSASFIGKRTPDVHGGSCSIQCCDADLCNNNCNGSAPVSSASPSVLIPTPAIFSTRPASVSVVKTTTSMTTSSTKMSAAPSSSMSTTALPVITLSTGLKAHGPTTATPSSKPRCHDSPGIDCHLLNTTLGVCNDANAGSTYCMKYCGLC